MTHWQHTDPRQCPQGHSMLWLGGTYWICEPCAKLYAEGKVQPSCNKCGSTEVAFRTRAAIPTPAAQPSDAVRLPGESQQHANERIAWERNGAMTPDSGSGVKS